MFTAMDLLFTLALRKEGTETPVLLTAPPGTSFSELEPLLHEYTEGKATWSLNGRPLGPEDVLVDVGLRDGAVLEALPMGDGPQGARSGSGAGGAVVAELEVVAGPSRGTRWRLKAGTYVIGRSAESDLVLASDEEVSRLHARLRVSAESTDVEDNGSTNGTFVAGQKLESQPVALEPGMMVEVGNSRIAVVSLAARPPGQPAVVKERPDGTQVFNRPPRIMARTEPVRLHVPPQPRERQKATLSLVGMAVPLVMGVVMGLLLKPI
jgi:pSer/pThr/pTyr-binding forkhead associated (FHA) protein